MEGWHRRLQAIVDSKNPAFLRMLKFIKNSMGSTNFIAGFHEQTKQRCCFNIFGRPRPS